MSKGRWKKRTHKSLCEEKVLVAGESLIRASDEEACAAHIAHKESTRSTLSVACMSRDARTEKTNGPGARRIGRREGNANRDAPTSALSSLGQRCEHSEREDVSCLFVRIGKRGQWVPRQHVKDRFLRAEEGAACSKFAPFAHAWEDVRNFR